MVSSLTGNFIRYLRMTKIFFNLVESILVKVDTNSTLISILRNPNLLSKNFNCLKTSWKEKILLKR